MNVSVAHYDLTCYYYYFLFSFSRAWCDSRIPYITPNAQVQLGPFGLILFFQHQSSIHPFSFTAYPALRVAEALEPIPAILGRRRGASWRLNQSNKQQMLQKWCCRFHGKLFMCRWFHSILVEQFFCWSHNKWAPLISFARSLDSDQSLSDITRMSQRIWTTKNYNTRILLVAVLFISLLVVR